MFTPWQLKLQNKFKYREIMNIYKIYLIFSLYLIDAYKHI